MFHKCSDPQLFHWAIKFAGGKRALLNSKNDPVSDIYGIQNRIIFYYLTSFFKGKLQTNDSLKSKVRHYIIFQSFKHVWKNNASRIDTIKYASTFKVLKKNLVSFKCIQNY